MGTEFDCLFPRTSIFGEWLDRVEVDRFDRRFFRDWLEIVRSDAANRARADIVKDVERWVEGALRRRAFCGYNEKDVADVCKARGTDQAEWLRHLREFAPDD